MPVPTYSLNELASLADVTPRTIRFYISQGLLPSPDPEGQKTRYTDEHLALLLAIKKLQSVHMPLAEIRRRARRPDRRGRRRGGRDDGSAAAGRSDRLHPRDARAARRRTTAARIRCRLHPCRRPCRRQPRHHRPNPRRPAPSGNASRSIQTSSSTSVARSPDQSNKRVERLIAIARELFEED